MKNSLHFHTGLDTAAYNPSALYGSWVSTTRLANRFGVVICCETYTFGLDGSLLWHYTETGADEQREEFTYVVNRDTISMNAVEHSGRDNAEYKIYEDLSGDMLAITFDDQQDAIMFKRG